MSVKFYQCMTHQTLKTFSVFAPWFKNIAIYKIVHYHHNVKLCKHFGICLHNFGEVRITSGNILPMVLSLTGGTL